MKKIAILCLLLGTIQLLFAQNKDSLLRRVVYDFSIGDTFQYKVYTTPLNNNPNTQREYKIRQVVVKQKRVDSTWRDVYITYIKDIKEFGKLTTKPNTLTPYYKNGQEIDKIYFRLEELNGKVTVTCPPIANPTLTNYCFDTITTDYNGRKTLKFESKKEETQAYKTYYAEGLGLTLQQGTRQYPDYYNDFELIYYNKKGQTWGARSPIFDNDVVAEKPLTMREVYDFDIGDIFIRSNDFYNFQMRQVDTHFVRETVLQKRLYARDSIQYMMKLESFNRSLPNKLDVVINTFIVKNLDSTALYQVKTNNSSASSLKKYIIEYHHTLTNTDRKIYGKNLMCDCVDYCFKHYVGQGIGSLYHYSCSFTPDESRLIYYKKGTETWGTPIDFSTSLFTPSVLDAKINLYPNPTNDVLHIETDLTDFHVKIAHLNGQILLKEANKTQVNLSHLPNGIYFLHVFEGEIGRGVKKFVVNH